LPPPSFLSAGPLSPRAQLISPREESWQAGEDWEVGSAKKDEDSDVGSAKREEDLDLGSGKEEEEEYDDFRRRAKEREQGEEEDDDDEEEEEEFFDDDEGEEEDQEQAFETRMYNRAAMGEIFEPAPLKKKNKPSPSSQRSEVKKTAPSSRPRQLPQLPNPPKRSGPGVARGAGRRGGGRGRGGRQEY
jgi:hypothetical protein